MPGGREVYSPNEERENDDAAKQVINDEKYGVDLRRVGLWLQIRTRDASDDCVKGECRRWRRVGPHARNGERQSGVTGVARHDAILVLVNAVRHARCVVVVARIRQARKDVKTPYGVRDHVEHGQHGRVEDTRDSRND